MIGKGWPTDQLLIVTSESTLFLRDYQHRIGAIQQQRVHAGLQLKRPVSGELSRVYLRVMYALAKEKGVQFEDIPDEPQYLVPSELQKPCDRFVAEDHFTTPEEDELLKLRYIHTSANWNHPLGKITGGGIDMVSINAPTVDTVRVQDPHVTDSDWTRW